MRGVLIVILLLPLLVIASNNRRTRLERRDGEDRERRETQSPELPRQRHLVGPVSLNDSSAGSDDDVESGQESDSMDSEEDNMPILLARLRAKQRAASRPKGERYEALKKCSTWMQVLDNARYFNNSKLFQRISPRERSTARNYRRILRISENLGRENFKKLFEDMAIVSIVRIMTWTNRQDFYNLVTQNRVTIDWEKFLELYHKPPKEEKAAWLQFTSLPNPAGRQAAGPSKESLVLYETCRELIQHQSEIERKTTSNIRFEDQSRLNNYHEIIRIHRLFNPQDAFIEIFGELKPSTAATYLRNDGWKRFVDDPKNSKGWKVSWDEQNRRYHAERVPIERAGESHSEMFRSDEAGSEEDAGEEDGDRLQSQAQERQRNVSTTSQEPDRNSQPANDQLESLKTCDRWQDIVADSKYYLDRNLASRIRPQDRGILTRYRRVLKIHQKVGEENFEILFGDMAISDIEDLTGWGNRRDLRQIDVESGATIDWKKFSKLYTRASKEERDEWLEIIRQQDLHGQEAANLASKETLDVYGTCKEVLEHEADIESKSRRNVRFSDQKRLSTYKTVLRVFHKFKPESAFLELFGDVNPISTATYFINGSWYGFLERYGKLDEWMVTWDEQNQCYDARRR